MNPRARALLRPAVLIPTLLVTVVVMVAVLGPWFAPYDHTRSLSSAYQAPNGMYLLGTDDMGRDVFSRLLSTGWPVLVTPLLAVAVTAIVGVGVGLLLVVRRSRGRQAVQVLDVPLTIPPILTLLMLGYVLPGGLWTVAMIAIVINAPFTARFVRSLADSYMDAGFVEVSLVEGHSRLSVAFGEILPNLWSPLLGELGTRFVVATYILVTAGFLGLSPLGRGGDWASMVTDALGGIMLNPAAVIAPTICISVLAVGVNLLADHWAVKR